MFFVANCLIKRKYFKKKHFGHKHTLLLYENLYHRYACIVLIQSFGTFQTCKMPFLSTSYKVAASLKPFTSPIQCDWVGPKESKVVKGYHNL